MGNQKGNPGENVVLYGYFLENTIKENEQCSDDSAGSDEDDWLDFDDINATTGQSYIKSQPLKRETVDFQDYKKGKFRVNGSFPMKDPWWAARITVSKPRGTYCFLKGYAAYELRQDDKVVEDGVVPLLLSKCNVSGETKSHFLQTVRSMGLYQSLKPTNLMEILEKYASMSDEYSCNARCITGRIRSGPGKMLFQCMTNPEIFKYLPQLYPRKIYNLLEKLDEDDEKMYKYATILRERPWVLAFSNVMRYKEDLFALEAPVNTLEISGLCDRMTQVQRDAIHIYEALNEMCRVYGHTYIYSKSLHGSKFLDGYQVKKWLESLKLLEDNCVTVMERDDDDSLQYTRVFLRRLWKAENSIADGIVTLFKKHKVSPWNIDIDFDSEQFADLLQDEDQKKAATLIATQPVVCLSGKGGCGKTHVASKVFQHADRLLKEEKERRMMEEMFNQSGMDDLTLTITVAEQERNLSFSDESTLGVLKDLESSQIEASPLSNPLAYGDSVLAEVLTSEVVLSQKRIKQEDGSQGGSRYVGDVAMETYEGNEAVSKKKEEDLEEIQPRILLSAPTGKAANLLGRRSKLPSSTLHQVIYNYRAWVRAKYDPKKRTRLPWKYGQVQALVVDECSLVSVSTFSTLLDMLVHHGDLQKIVLLGDIHQLPSIEPGTFLVDVYESLRALGCSHTLTTNHRSESQLIIDNAARIARQQAPVIDPERRFFSVPIEVTPLPGETEVDIGLDQDAMVGKILKEFPCMVDHTKSQFVAYRRADCARINEICCRHYSGHPTQNSEGRRMFQVGDKVCCTKNTLTKDFLSEKGVRLCNGEIFLVVADVTEEDSARHSRLEVSVNHSCTPAKDQPSTSTGATPGNNTTLTSPTPGNDTTLASPTPGNNTTFTSPTPGNNTILASPTPGNNTTLAPPTPGNNTTLASPLGYTQAANTNYQGNTTVLNNTVVSQGGPRSLSTRYLVLSDGENPIIKIPFVVLKRKCKLMHAWARTIHTYQGSESDTVVYVVGNGRGQTWQHVYTAVTRGRKHVIMLARDEDLQAAITRKPGKRSSMLKRRMAENFSDWQKEVKEQDSFHEFFKESRVTDAPNSTAKCNGDANPDADMIDLPFSARVTGNGSAKRSLFDSNTAASCSKTEQDVEWSDNVGYLPNYTSIKPSVSNIPAEHNTTDSASKKAANLDESIFSMFSDNSTSGFEETSFNLLLPCTSIQADGANGSNEHSKVLQPSAVLNTPQNTAEGSKSDHCSSSKPNSASLNFSDWSQGFMDEIYDDEDKSTLNTVANPLSSKFTSENGPGTYARRAVNPHQTEGNTSYEWHVHTDNQYPTKMTFKKESSPDVDPVPSTPKRAFDHSRDALPETPPKQRCLLATFEESIVSPTRRLLEKSMVINTPGKPRGKP